jgi:S1-C subfamily serine protease
MKRLVLALILFSACCAGPVKAVEDARRLGADEFHSVVQLTNKVGRTFCSGVIVDHKILTAYHCIEGGEPVWIEGYVGRFEAALWGDDPTADLAVLVPADGRTLPKGVKLARRAPTWGDEVWVIGHPLGTYTNSITRGIVSHPHREDGIFGGLWFQHDAGQIGGNSGGPVYNKKGQLVGIVSFGIIQGIYCVLGCQGAYQDTHLNGAVHLTPIRSLLR